MTESTSFNLISLRLVERYWDILEIDCRLTPRSNRLSVLPIEGHDTFFLKMGKVLTVEFGMDPKPVAVRSIRFVRTQLLLDCKGDSMDRVFLTVEEPSNVVGPPLLTRHDHPPEIVLRVPALLTAIFPPFLLEHLTIE